MRKQPLRLAITTEDDIAQMEEIQYQIDVLLGKAEKIMRAASDPLVWERARSYWFGHMQTSLFNQGGYSTTMDDTIEEMRALVDDYAENTQDVL